jgi:hypothetical protein
MEGIIALIPNGERGFEELIEEILGSHHANPVAQYPTRITFEITS